MRPILHAEVLADPASGRYGMMDRYGMQIIFCIHDACSRRVVCAACLLQGDTSSFRLLLERCPFAYHGSEAVTAANVALSASLSSPNQYSRIELFKIDCLWLEINYPGSLLSQVLPTGWTSIYEPICMQFSGNIIRQSIQLPHTEWCFEKMGKA